MGGMSCLPCVLGSFSSTKVHPSATGVPGQIQQLDRRGRMLCPQGKFQPSSGQELCTLCAAGTFTNKTAQTECSQCVAGKFQQDYGGVACDECPVGQSQPDEGAMECNTCEAGTYRGTNDVATECLMCSMGQFSGSAASARCSHATSVNTKCNRFKLMPHAPVQGMVQTA